VRIANCCGRLAVFRRGGRFKALATKMAALAGAGVADVVSGGSFTASLTYSLSWRGHVNASALQSNAQGERREAAAGDVWFVSELPGCLSFAPPCGLELWALVKKSGVIPFSVFVP
jgi:hypothetical protein